MTEKQIELVKSTWGTVTTLDPLVVGDLFYGRLFSIAPELRPMFRNPITEQSKKLLATINFVIVKLDKLNDIIDEVSKLARRHVTYGVKAWHYSVVGSALLWTLEKGLAEKWNEETAEAWTTCYQLLSNAMIEVSGEVQQTAA